MSDLERRGGPHAVKLATTILVLFTFALTLVPSGVADIQSGDYIAVPVFTYVNLSPGSGPVGSQVTVTGAGFVPAHALTITYDGSTTGMPASCASDPSGTVKAGCVFSVPASTLGAHMVGASDGTNHPTSSFLVVSPSVSLSVDVLVAYSGAAVTVSLAGCSVSPTAIQADGANHSLKASPGCMITATLPPRVGNSRYVGPLGTQTFIIHTCQSGTCPAFSTTIYRQFLIAVYYSVNGGGSPAAPTFRYYSHGTAVALVLTKKSSPLWVDATIYSATSPLKGSNLQQRWFSSKAKGTISKSITLNLVYYHQFYVTPMVKGPGTTNLKAGWFTWGFLPITATPTKGHSFVSWSSSTILIRFISPGAASTLAIILATGRIFATFS